MNKKILAVAAGGLTVAGVALAWAYLRAQDALWFTRGRWPVPKDLVDAPRPEEGGCSPDCCGGLYGDHTDGVVRPGWASGE